MRVLLAIVIAVLALGADVTAPAQAQSFPDRPIKIIVPYPAGGPSDTVARIAAQGLSAEIGQAAIVENVAGAGGKVGTKAVTRAAPDGYTLLIGSSNEYAITPALSGNLDFDPTKELVPVAAVATDSNALVVNPSLPVQTLGDLVRYAKDHPGQLNAGSTIGIAPHLMIAFFRARTGADIQFIPYKGGAPAIADVVAGQIQINVSAKAVLLPLIKAGRLRALAVASAERWPELPDVPTLRESGLDGYPTDIWFGLMAPEGTPAAVIAKINAAENAGLASAESQAAIRKLGMQPRRMNADEFGTVLRREVQVWGAVARETGIKLD